MKKAKGIIVLSLLVCVGLSGFPKKECLAATCPPHSSYRDWYTCIGSGHSYHMVPVPDAIDEYGQPLKARCDRDHELMNYTVECGICGTEIGCYRVDFITHYSRYCENYGSIEKKFVNY